MQSPVEVPENAAPKHGIQNILDMSGTVPWSVPYSHIVDQTISNLYSFGEYNEVYIQNNHNMCRQINIIIDFYLS